MNGTEMWTLRAHRTPEGGFAGNVWAYHPDGDLEHYVFPGQDGYKERA